MFAYGKFFYIIQLIIFLVILFAIGITLQACSLVAVNEGRYRKPVEGLLIAQHLIWIDQRSTLFSKGAL